MSDTRDIFHYISVLNVFVLFQYIFVPGLVWQFTWIRPDMFDMLNIPQERTRDRSDLNSVRMRTTSGMFMMHEFNDNGKERRTRSAKGDNSKSLSRG